MTNKKRLLSFFRIMFKCNVYVPSNDYFHWWVNLMIIFFLILLSWLSNTFVYNMSEYWLERLSQFPRVRVEIFIDSFMLTLSHQQCMTLMYWEQFKISRTISGQSLETGTSKRLPAYKMTEMMNRLWKQMRMNGLSIPTNWSTDRLMVLILDRLILCSASGPEQYLICEFEIHKNTITDKRAGLKQEKGRSWSCPSLLKCVLRVVLESI